MADMFTDGCSTYMYVSDCFLFLSAFQRPPSSSLSAYGTMLGAEHVDHHVRSPSSGGGTPTGILPPGSHLSGDNVSEAGKTQARSTFVFKIPRRAARSLTLRPTKKRSKIIT